MNSDKEGVFVNAQAIIALQYMHRDGATILLVAFRTVLYPVGAFSFFYWTLIFATVPCKSYARLLRCVFVVHQLISLFKE